MKKQLVTIGLSCIIALSGCGSYVPEGGGTVTMTRDEYDKLMEEVSNAKNSNSQNNNNDVLLRVEDNTGDYLFEAIGGEEGKLFNTEPSSDTKSSWNVKGKHEGGMPEDIFEKIKGAYYAEVNGIILRVISPKEILFDNGSITTYTIHSCECIGDELVLYVTDDEYDSEHIVSAFYNDEGEVGLLLREGGFWDFDKTHVYSSLGKVSEDPLDKITRKDSASDNENTSVNTDSEQYVVGDCDIKKEGSDYYIYPLYDNTYIFPVDGGNGVPFNSKLKISKDAKIGVATSFYTTSDGECEDGHFSYEYFDFYKKVDDFFSNGHWQKKDDKFIWFEVDGAEMPLTPIISFDGNGDINQIMEYYSP